MVSIIIPCKKRLNHLKKTFPNMLRQGYRDIEVIVIDYMCPQGTFDYVERNKDERTVCIRAQVGADEWNLSASRNLGYRHSKGDILLFIDADSMLNHKFVGDCLKRLKPNSFLSGNQQPPYEACGCSMVYRSDFEKVKGYNELTQGWGSEDFNFYDRLKAEGLEHLHFNYGLIKNIPHSDSIRNEYHGWKDRMDSNHENYLSMQKGFKGL